MSQQVNKNISFDLYNSLKSIKRKLFVSVIADSTNAAAAVAQAAIQQAQAAKQMQKQVNIMLQVILLVL